MADPRTGLLGVALLISVLLLVFGCNEDIYTGQMKANVKPEIHLTNGPLEGDTVQYRVHFYWLGYDEDGTVDHYELALVEGDPFGFNPADTAGPDKWINTISTDSLLVVNADEYDKNITINYSLYALYDKTHTFFVRAVDDRGAVSDVAYRSFTAYTLAPGMNITFPKNPMPGSSQFLANIVTFVWQGKDPIDMPWNYQDVESVRYFCRQYYGYTVDDLNKDPGRFESWWGPWIPRDAPGDSGRTTVMGDDEILQINRDYIFAVQGKDEAGAVTSVFSKYNNVRHFYVIEPTGPRLTVKEPILGHVSFLGTNFDPAVYHVPTGFPMNFSWIGDASKYGGIVSTYRYGWDVSDLDDPTEWDCSPNPLILAAPTKKFYSGVHTLYVESVDDFGAVTLAQIEINVVSASMERNLLWVDDFYSTNFPQLLYAMPTESSHDEFWVDLCSRAEGFDSDLDVYDTNEMGYIPTVPEVQRIMRYKNIIWTYTSDAYVCAWGGLVQFVPESAEQANPNILVFYLTAGGHIWTNGKSDRNGGLAAVLPMRRAFPINLRCEIWGVTTGCADTSGVTSFAYRDYCVNILDKVYASFREDIGIIRDLDYDGMVRGYIDNSDPITASHPEFPDVLELWEEVTKPGRFFDPQVRGFTYVEVYNPTYWMNYTESKAQSCYHPIYRLVTRSSRSPIDDEVIAFWTTRYAHIKPDAEGTIAAPSVHFGIPLWFFNRDQARAVADAVFREWEINMY
jgi:hypothetical protein